MSPIEALKTLRETWAKLQLPENKLDRIEDFDDSENVDRVIALNEQLAAALEVLRASRYSATVRVESWELAKSLEKALNSVNFGKLLEPLAEDDFWDLMYPLTASRYFDRLLKAACFVNAADLPKELDSLFAEAKACYAFGKDNAVCCLCRAALEKASRDISLRTGRIDEARFNLAYDDENYPRFWDVIKKAGASGPFKDRIEDLYKRLCGVVHGSRHAQSSDALKVFGETVSVVRQLYLINRQALSS